MRNFHVTVYHTRPDELGTFRREFYFQTEAQTADDLEEELARCFRNIGIGVPISYNLDERAVFPFSSVTLGME